MVKRFLVRLSAASNVCLCIRFVRAVTEDERGEGEGGKRGNNTWVCGDTKFLLETPSMRQMTRFLEERNVHFAKTTYNKPKCRSV